ncbi:ABC transporter permease DevC [Gimesia aquarii]|uniref:FtsX-like permease family protein n=1 Tax=Gimesia aquarii TaxID=2527964 RepID=A0A517WQG3_9PLAN|nr:ABC transporter permease DevC [Gimesia aquarii]QDU07502.1 FtsX-like permease family protein [Gimesia aquarii]
MVRLPASLRVGWQQVSHNKTKLLVASAGVIVAVMLMLVQLGIRRGAIDSSIAVAKRLTADVVVVSPRTKTIFQPSSVPRSMFYRVLADPEVERVQSLYVGRAVFRNPWSDIEFPISVYGIDPDRPMMDLPGYESMQQILERADRICFDRQSRPTYGPVADELDKSRSVITEVNHREVHVVGSVSVGVSINTDGNLYVSPANFLRLFPDRNPGSIDIGLVRLTSDSDPQAVASSLSELLGKEARVLPCQDLVDAEETYLRETAPLDFIFGMGTAVGFFIGFVVVYQILYTEVTNHLPHYATLKAMGFRQSFLVRIVLSQAVIFSIFGFVPGFLMALGIYSVATDAIQMPIIMTIDRAVTVFAVTLSMCGLSGLIAIRQLSSAQPADVF